MNTLNVDDEHILLRLKNSVGIHSSWFSGLIYLDTHTVVDDNFLIFALNLLFSGQCWSLKGMSSLKSNLGCLQFIITIIMVEILFY